MARNRKGVVVSTASSLTQARAMVEATRRAVAASRDILERIDAALPRRIRKPTALVQPATSRMPKGPPAG